MQKIWDNQNKFRKHALIEAKHYVHSNSISEESEKDLMVKILSLSYDENRIKEIEEKTKHEFAAFLQYLKQNLGGEVEHFHIGLTSSDILDTTLAIQIDESLELIIEAFFKFEKTILSKIKEHRKTLMIGRTHGVHAEITTFGLVLSSHFFELQRAYVSLTESIDAIRVGKLSGPVGTYSGTTIEAEQKVLESFGLSPENCSTQVVCRDRYSKLLFALAQISTAIERLATNIRNLHRTEIGEVKEGFAESQKGSSAMPHKQNPVLCESLCGLSRIVRNNVNLSLENCVLWNERDMSHSSVERRIIPESLSIVEFMLIRINGIVSNMFVDSQKMLDNIDMTRGLCYSSTILNALLKLGANSEESYKAIQEISFMVHEDNKTTFFNELKKNEYIKQYLDDQKIEYLCSKNNLLNNIDKIYQKMEYF